MTPLMVAPPIACQTMSTTSVVEHYAPLSYSEVTYLLRAAGVEPITQAPRRWAVDDVHALPHFLPGRPAR